MQNVSKRTILWIVPILIIILFWYFYGPKEEITDNEYITYIKEETGTESSSKTYGTAFANYCEEGKWVYFQTQKNQHVVEFKGNCPTEDKAIKVNLQFVVENEQSGYQIGAMLLDDVQLSEEERDGFIHTIMSN